MKNTIGYIVCILLALFTACDIKKNKEADPKGFFKIYNEENYSAQFTPLDIEQTSDEGYLILSAAKITISSFPGIYIMKIDKNGLVLYTKLLDEMYVSPVPNLMRNGSEYYIVCMDRQNLGTYILQLDETGAETQTGFMPDMQYPLSADIDSYIPGDIIIQHYNKDDQITLVSSVSKAGDIVASRSFSIGTGEGFDVKQRIIDHMTGNGKKYPFQCGRFWDDNFYFNGFYNYTLSLCVFDYSTWEDGDKPAVTQGYSDQRYLSSVLPLSSNGIAGSRSGYEDNYFIPYSDVPNIKNTFAASSDMPGYFIPELMKDAPVSLKHLTLSGKDVLLYASTTKSSQVALYAYELTTGQIIGTKYLGATNPYAMASVIKTSDEGLAVLATTQVAGRFSRIAVFKLSKEELEW